MNDWFEWNGVRCTQYGIHVSELPPPTIPSERVTYTNVPGRPGSLTTLEGEDVYEDVVLTAQCFLSDPTKIPAIAAWLKGSGKVAFAHRQGGFYYARIANQISFEKILRGNPHRSFAVNFRSKPFWYQADVAPVTLTTSTSTIDNPGSVYSEPVITVYGTGDITLMVGTSHRGTGRYFRQHHAGFGITGSLLRHDGHEQRHERGVSHPQARHERDKLDGRGDEGRSEAKLEVSGMICVYTPDCTDFSGNGLGPVSPLSCTVTETLNGEWELTLEHPLDDAGKWRRLVEGCILRAPVPAAMTPGITMITQATPEVKREVWKVRTNGSRLMLRSGTGTKYKIIGKYHNGTEVVLLEKTTSSWYKMLTPDGKQGYMSTDWLQYVRTEVTPGQGEAVNEVVEARQLRDQPFRIYRVVPELDKITVYARHVFYDLMDNMIRKYEPSATTTGANVAQGIASGCLSEHDCHLLFRPRQHRRRSGL